MRHLKDIFPDGIVMSPTDKFSGFWEGHVPPSSIYPGYDPVAVKQVIERQERLFNEKYAVLLANSRKTGQKVHKSQVKIDPVFIICDDCMAANSLKSDPQMTEIFMNGRHLKIFLLIMAQWMMDMPINKRQLTDYLLVCAEDSPPALRRLYDNFFSNYIPSYQAFCDIIEQVTDDYGLLVLDRTRKSKKIEDHIFWWKCQLHEPYSFRIGCDEWWQYSKEQYHEEFAEQSVKEKYYTHRTAHQGPRVQVHRLQ